MRRFFSAVVLSSLLVVASGGCETNVNECGPFPDKFKTTGFLTETYRLVPGMDSDVPPELRPIEEQAVLYSDLAIQMRPRTETYFSSRASNAGGGSDGFHLVPAAYACSPIPPSSDEIIRSIRVVADQDFGEAYPAGADLAPLFDVLVRDSARGLYYRRFDLDAFVATQPDAAEELVLVLDTTLQTETTAQFTVTYRQDGRGIGRYTFETQPVTLAPGGE